MPDLFFCFGTELVIVPETTQKERENLLTSLNTANRAAISFLAGEVSLDDMLDIVESTGLRMDDYLEQVEENLIWTGVSL